MAVYEFVCDRMIPGCTYTEPSETEKEARKNARRHLEDHHRMEVLDDSTSARINMAVIGIHR
jgi:predicted small metal-binding protein